MVSIAILMLLFVPITIAVVAEIQQRRHSNAALSLAFDRGYRASMIVREEWWPRGSTFSYY